MNKIIFLLFVTFQFMIQIYSQNRNIINETEPNNTLGTANLIAYSDTVHASISPIGDIDYFKFNIINRDTVILFVGLINNSQLWLNYSITGNIISWDEYGDSIFIILGSGICYLKMYSPSNITILSSSNIRNSIVNDSLSSPTIRYGSNSIFGILKGNQLEIMEQNKSYNTASDTGDYQIILKRYSPGKPIISSNTDFGSFNYNTSSIFDELTNSLRFRLYFYPNGSITTIRWEYGNDITYGNIKEYPETFNGAQEYCAVTKLNGLIPNTTYHYRIHASNEFGDTYSDDYTFTTPSTPDNNIDIVKPEIYINYNDTSFLASAGGGWIYILLAIKLQSIAFQDNFNGWITGDYIDFLHTNDGGNTWLKKNIIGTNFANRVFFTDVKHGFCVSLGNNNTIIFNTNDGGNTWEKKSTIPLYYYGQFGGFSFSDSLHGTIAGQGEDGINFNDTILNTTNGGITWNQQNSGIIGTWNQYSGVSLVDPLNCIIVGRNFSGHVILHTTDNGNIWEYQNSGLNNFIPTGVSFSDVLHGTIIGYDNSNYPIIEGIILHTTNGGITWNEQNSGIIIETYNPPLENVSFLDSLNGVIVGVRGNILKTSDGGETWNQIQSGTHNDLYSVTLMNNKFYIAGVYETILKGDIVTSVNEEEITPPKFELSQNYPNPFNPSTKINYSIPRTSFVTLKIYDILGKEVKTLVNEEKPVGNYEAELDGTKLSSGIYFYRLQAGSFTETKKFILMK